MEPEQAKRLGQHLRKRREGLGWSTRDLAERAAVNYATITRIENGDFAAPRPDKLSRIAEALELELADVFAMADYVVPANLPTLAPYLRAKYGDMPDDALEQIERYATRLARKHGMTMEGPAPGEDESP